MPYISKIKLPDDVTYDINLPSTAQINIDSINGLSADAIKNGTVHTVMSGFTTTNGNSTSGSYLSVKWKINGIDEITTPYDGMKVMIKIPKVGVATAGVVMSIDNGTTYHPCAANASTVLSSQYAVDTIRLFTYDATATMDCYLSSNVVTTVTGVWKGESNVGTVTSVRVQAGTGLSSSTSSAQTSSLNTTISIDSGYKLPTTTEWNALFTNPMTSYGDLIYGSDGTGTPGRLGASVDRKFLRSYSSTLAWDTVDGVEIKSHTTAGGSTNATSGYVLAADGSGGTSWVAQSSGMTNPMSQPGDLIIGGTSGTPTRLANSASTSFLKGAAGSTYWGDVQGTDIKSGTSGSYVTSGKVLTANGSGAVTWENPTTTTSGTLASANWSSGSQTITVNGVTSSNLVVVSPAPASVEAYGNARIYCAAQSTNSLTFTCLGTTPSTDLTVNIAIW